MTLFGFSHIYRELGGTAMIELPIGRQTFDFDCGAKALQIVMAYYGIDIPEGDLIRELRCDTNGTPCAKYDIGG
jgi:predicted double-glycine peptidase